MAIFSDQTEHLYAIFHGDRVYSLEIFLQDSPISGFEKSLSEGRSATKPPAQSIMSLVASAISFAFMNFGGIGENRVDEIGAGRLLFSFVRRCNAAAVQRLRPVDHIDDFLFQMAHLRGAVVVHHGEGCAGHTVDLAGLAAAVALTVERRELDNHVHREFGLATHENPVPGYEHIVENQGRAVLGVKDIPAVAAVNFPRVETGSANDMDQPGVSEGMAKATE
jgi:hypothetical protein